ncbi:general stress protein [Microbacterium invictum]|uniref:General stress protein 17M-like domain-containing protein n=1 Tax=Microbacterium invictum TaxID=515415 RepID=A0AA40SM52_9MICO|nr:MULTISPECIES: general stress protein [Microbacterium]MBB4138770.1 hypothetical protein [Microbacterium invictum]
MSMMGGTPREHGEKIAEFSTYEGAQKAVTALIEAEIPAKDIAIVGRSLRSVETVTGRLGYAAAARTGAINGILLGLVFSAIFVLGTPNAAIQLFIGVMLVGIAVGMLMSLLTYAIVRRRRAYTSMTQLIADHYEITVLPRSIHRAREVVGHTVATVTAHPADPPASAPVAAPHAPVAPPDVEEPPRYGERISPVSEQPAPPADEAPRG